MAADLLALFSMMTRMRAVELALAELWERGLISGELHLGIGEEGIVAGVTSHLGESDALALDHRSTPPLVAIGVDIAPLVLEMLGHDQGLNHGRGGHMHLFAPERRAASSGIVGSSGPLACGFALSAARLRPGSVAVAFFGEAAMNQGMLMEALNLAAAWNLPVLFVCKDDGWSITTRSQDMTGGNVAERAAAFGLVTVEVDGSDVEAVWTEAGRLIDGMRNGRGPVFLHASCYRPHGHFEDFQLLRLVRSPRELSGEIGHLLKRLARPNGAAPRARLAGMARVIRTLGLAATHQFGRHKDPLVVAEKRLPAGGSDLRRNVETTVAADIEAALQSAGVS